MFGLAVNISKLINDNTLPKQQRQLYQLIFKSDEIDHTHSFKFLFSSLSITYTFNPFQSFPCIGWNYDRTSAKIAWYSLEKTYLCNRSYQSVQPEPHTARWQS